MRATFLQLLIIIVIIITNLGNQQKTAIVSTLTSFPSRAADLVTRIFCCGLTLSALSRKCRGLPQMKNFAAAIHEQLFLVAKSGETVTLVSSLTCCQMGWNLWFPCSSSDAMILTFPALSFLICTSPPACPKQILCGFRKAPLFNFTEIASHPRPFFYNIHLAPTRKAIKFQRKLELSHIYIFTASSLESTKISGCLKLNKPWKYMYRHTGTSCHDGEHSLCPYRNWVITTSDPWGCKTKTMPHYY